MRERLVLCAIAVAHAACSSTDPHASPEAAMRAYLSAANHREVDAMRALAVPPERLRRALSCPPDDKRIDAIEAVANAREDMAMYTGMAVRNISVSELSHRTVAVGETYADCRATEPFELGHIRIQLSYDDGAGRREKTEDGDAIRLDDRWYLVVPTPSSRHSPD